MTLVVAGSPAASHVVTRYAPDNAAITYSDYCAIDLTSVRARFVRPTIDGRGFEHCNPGVRARFKTNSTFVRVLLRYTNLVTDTSIYNADGQILVDGVEARTFTFAFAALPGTCRPSLLFGAATERTFEVVLPFGTSVDFEGVELDPGATLSAAAARPATRFVCFGDSITHGIGSSYVGASWPTLLAGTKNWQMVNHGYGGRRVIAADGTAAGGLTPSVATYLIGYNNFFDQTALATFKTDFKSVLTNFRAVAPLVKLYCITPLWTDNVAALTIEQYRQQIRDGITEIGSALNVLVEGEPLATNNLTHFPDHVHPNDAACVEIAAALASAVSV